MTYSIEFTVGNTKFTMAEDSIDELMEDYEHAGGDAKWYLSEVEDVIASSREVHSNPAPTTNRGRQSANDDAGPWGEDPGSWDDEAAPGGGPQAASKPPARQDPWDGTEVEDKPARRRSAPSRGNQRPSRPAQDDSATGDVEQSTDKFGRVWTVGLPDAPTCHCGEPAARMKAKSQKGNKYTKFKCAKGAPGGDWQDKCDFDEFPPR